MIVCPNCERALGKPLSHRRGGQCPFCDYKLGDADLRARADAPEARRFAKFRKRLKSVGVSDEKIEEIWNMTEQAQKQDK